MSDLNLFKPEPSDNEFAQALARTPNSDKIYVSRATPEPEVASVVLEDIADDRIWRARIGVPGVYVAHSGESESVYFLVTSFFDCRRGRMAIRVFPLSLWENGACTSRVAFPEVGERLPFLPSCVLWAKCDFGRLPDGHRELLVQWAKIILDGIDYYDETHPRRPSKTHSG